MYVFVLVYANFLDIYIVYIVSKWRFFEFIKLMADDCQNVGSVFSYISGISLLGLPAEMYTYGTQYWMCIFPEIFLSVTMAVVYLPVFYKLQITSSYEVLHE